MTGAGAKNEADLREAIDMYNILVCDDDKEIVKAIEIYLIGEKYNVFKAYNGQEAMDILDKEERFIFSLLM